MTKSDLLKVVRAHCLDCCCGSYEEVKHCGCPTCNLYPYRFGTDPTKRVLSPAQLAHIEQMHIARDKKREESNAEGDAADDIR